MKTKSSRKILFLDIDGVLNIVAVRRSELEGVVNSVRYHGDWVLKEKVQMLNWLMNYHPDLEIVISSAWRIHTTEEQIFETLRLAGFNHPNPIIGSTPSCSFNHPLRRSIEILDWMDDNDFWPSPNHKFVILDDSKDAGGFDFEQYFVKLSGVVGLTESACEIIDKILLEKS